MQCNNVTRSKNNKRETTSLCACVLKLNPLLLRGGIECKNKKILYNNLIEEILVWCNTICNEKMSKNIATKERALYERNNIICRMIVNLLSVTGDNLPVGLV